MQVKRAKVGLSTAVDEPLPSDVACLVKPLEICSRCIYDSRLDGIEFDQDGVCNYCRQSDLLLDQFGTGQEKGEREFDSIIAQIKRDGKGKKYDCVIGVSGGTDSSYMLYLAKERGLRPLAVHYDNTWNSAIATQNIFKVLNDLDIDLFTYVVNNNEIDDIFKSLFKAGVAELDSPTDLALTEVLYRAASKFGVKYVLEGHSFVTEGIAPLGRNYFDGKYIREIHKRYGTQKLATYPLMDFKRFMWWTCVKKIRKVRPFWYLNYNKETARQFLMKKCGWQYYGGHHLENRITAFLHQVYLPEKFGMDFRNLTLAASARNGVKRRTDALKQYNEPIIVDNELIRFFKKRLGLSDREYAKVMTASPRHWSEFPTYKKRFELLRPLFFVLAKLSLVPTSFYLKYCFPIATKAGKNQ